MGRFDKEKIMLLEMSRKRNMPVDEIIRESIQNSYAAFKAVEPLLEIAKKYDLFKTEQEETEK